MTADEIAEKVSAAWQEATLGGKDELAARYQTAVINELLDCLSGAGENARRLEAASGEALAALRQVTY